jgi:uncharacterized repeat protein (TIGR03803 family)
VLKLSGREKAFAVFLFCATTAVVSSAQTFKTLVSFDGTNGANPEYVALIQGTDGNFYGTTLGGGANFQGTVFRINAAGALTTLYSFCAQSTCPDGAEPQAGLVEGSNGNFYGTTPIGGANESGTVFEITPAGKLTTIYSFCPQSGCSDGANPYAGLVLASDGNFYGTTHSGGANSVGTVFKITPGGKLTTLHNFCSQTSCMDGANPYSGLIQATDGNFYGTTFISGANGSGTVFKITPAGTLTTLYSFCAQTNCADGAYPYAALVQGTDGNFYGTTNEGGTRTYGTVFKITRGGTLTSLYSFCVQTNCTDGQYPYAGLVQAPNKKFYGTTSAGGDIGAGTAFTITSKGTLITLHAFDDTDGTQPYGGLLQATSGTFYGTTYQGATNSDGTVFSLAAGLGAFVETQPTSGKVGAAVIILGTNLKGTSSVTFNGTAAKFTVISKSEIKTTVPAGATTGTVQVTTSKKTLKSNVVFRIEP